MLLWFLVGMDILDGIFQMKKEKETKFDDVYAQKTQSPKKLSLMSWNSCFSPCQREKN
jgi:hypothetical protein